MGLRSLYFTLAATLEKLHRLRYGLVAILAFVGLKMMLSNVYPISILVSLAVLGSAVAISVVWSLLSRPESSKIPSKKSR
jgi:tellurite resistance protein TerC